MDTEYILGIKVSNLTLEDICRDVIFAIKNNQKLFIASINPEISMVAVEDDKVKKILNNATHNLPDGIGVVMASRILKGGIKQRVAGIDCAEALCRTAQQNNFNVFLYGAKKGVAEKAKENLQKKYPGLNIVGVIDGYEEDNEKVITKINASKANIVLVALGGQKQEKWISKNMDKVNAQVFQCVGGSFDVFSGNSKRAPKIVQKLGAEWLFRLIKEPSRFRRQAKIPKFIHLVFQERKIKNRQARKTR